MVIEMLVIAIAPNTLITTERLADGRLTPRDSVNNLKLLIVCSRFVRVDAVDRKFDLSNWLDSCFDEAESLAPLRAFSVGAGLASFVIVICCVAVDPMDVRMLLLLLGVAVLLGGGCSAMFALPGDQFAQTWKFAFRLWPLIPMKFFVGGGVIPFVFMSFVDILSIAVGLTVIRVLVRFVMSFRHENRRC